MSTTTTRPAPTGTRYIYGLCDADGRVRYVGQTTDVRARLRGHLHQAELRTSPVYRWLRELGEPPAVVILQVTPPGDADRAEREWILRLRAAADPAAPLLNVRPGLATAAAGRPKTAEHRAAISAGLRRYYGSRRLELVSCPGCGRSFSGSKGLNLHLHVRPACRKLPSLGIAA